MEEKDSLQPEQADDENKEYRIPWPFSDDDRGILVSKERREEWNTKHQAFEKKEKEEQEMRRKRREKIEALWYVDPTIGSSIWAYGDRIAQVFLDENISHVDQVPERLRLIEQKSNTALQLFSQVFWVQKIEREDDYYATEIKRLLGEYEQLNKRFHYLDDDEIGIVENLFVKWVVRDLSLFARYEALKKENKRITFVSRFRFGRPHFRKHHKIGSVPKEVEFVDNHNMYSINFGLRTACCTPEDLTSSTYSFLEKVEKSYKRDVRKDILYKSRQYLDGLSPEQEDSFSFLLDDQQLFIKQEIKHIVSEQRWNEMTKTERNQAVSWFSKNKDGDFCWSDYSKKILKSDEKYRLRYGWFHSSKMKKILGIDKEIQERWQYEAKKEIIENFDSFFDDVDLSKLSYYDGLILSIEKYQTEMYIPYVPSLLLNIERYQKDFGCEHLDVNALKTKIVKKLSELYLFLLEKVKNKENIPYKYARRSDSPYNVMGDIIGSFQDLSELIEEFNPDVLSTLPPVDEIKNLYAQEYVDYFLLEMIKKKCDWLDAASFSTLIPDEKKEIEDVFIQQLAKRYIDDNLSMTHEFCSSGMDLNDWYDAITRWWENELLKLWIIFSFDDMLSSVLKNERDANWFRDITGFEPIHYDDTPPSEEQKDKQKNQYQKFYVFQRKIIKTGIDYIHKDLLDLQKFSIGKMSMIKIMKWDYETYYGEKSDIIISWDAINAVYYKFTQSKIDNYFASCKKFFKWKKMKRDHYIKPYIQQTKIIFEIRDFIQSTIPVSYSIIYDSSDTFDIKYTLLLQKNKKYEGQYCSTAINAFSFFLCDMDILLANSSPEMATYFNNVFSKIEKDRPKILGLRIQHWLFENGRVEGRLHRIIYEHILKNSWDPAVSSDQVSFAIEYIFEQLLDIIWKDFNAVSFDWKKVWDFDKPLFDSIVKEYLEKWKDWLKNMKKLWEDGKSIEIE